MPEFVGVADDVDRLNSIGLELERERVMDLTAGTHKEAGGAVDAYLGLLHAGHETKSTAKIGTPCLTER